MQHPHQARRLSDRSCFSEGLQVIHSLSLPHLIAWKTVLGIWVPVISFQLPKKSRNKLRKAPACVLLPRSLVAKGSCQHLDSEEHWGVAPVTKTRTNMQGQASTRTPAPALGYGTPSQSCSEDLACGSLSVPKQRSAFGTSSHKHVPIRHKTPCSKVPCSPPASALLHHVQGNHQPGLI